MPQKMYMFISNGNKINHTQKTTSLVNMPKSSSALNAPILDRIHNVKAGCGSCGRH